MPRSPIDYDPLSPEAVADPYPIYARLRASCPVLWHDRLDSWVLTRYRDCIAVLRDPARFASDARRAGHEAPPGAEHPSLQGLDPPEHTPIRDLFANALREQAISGLGELVAVEATAAFARLADAPSFDFTADVARPIALTAMSRLLGVAPPAIASIVALSDAVERAMDAALVPEAIGPALAARGQMNELMKSWVGDGLKPGLLAQVLDERHGAGVPEAAVWSTARVMFLAGFSTTVSAASNMVLAMFQHPGALDRLRDPRLLETGVDELMRYDGPIQGTSRICLEATTIDETRIERGQVVLLLFGAANRDPEQFAAPDELTLDRRPNRHLAFGRGPHACTGTQLARIVLQALLGSMLRLRAPLRLAGPVRRQRRATVRYPDRLPLTLQAA
ncbi:cytochrome P450 [Sorangium sp. So ce119]|uniref:cytochrome P450 n=1 Tax=Sorangium sp. So ce119 TaxID=3133279 RepID=UPI003F60FD30